MRAVRPKASERPNVRALAWLDVTLHIAHTRDDTPRRMCTPDRGDYLYIYFEPEEGAAYRTRCRYLKNELEAAKRLN